LHEPTLDKDLSRGAGKPGVVPDAGLGERKEDITTTCFAFQGKDAGSLVLGSDEGKIYKARLHDEKTLIYETIDRAHDAPITAIEWHPGQPKTPGNLGELFLTSSYDWTVRLWSQRSSAGPILTFESSKDYVYDVQWSPVHPALFASCDGTGRIDLWDLSVDTEVPVHTVHLGAAPTPVATAASSSSSSAAAAPTSPVTGGGGAGGEAGEEKEGPACSRLRWSDDGLSLAVGTSGGLVMVYGITEALALPAKDSAANFSAKITAALQPKAPTVLSA